MSGPVDDDVSIYLRRLVDQCPYRYMSGDPFALETSRGNDKSKSSKNRLPSFSTPKSPPSSKKNPSNSPPSSKKNPPKSPPSSKKNPSNSPPSSKKNPPKSPSSSARTSEQSPTCSITSAGGEIRKVSGKAEKKVVQEELWDSDFSEFPEHLKYLEKLRVSQLKANELGRRVQICWRGHRTSIGPRNPKDKMDKKEFVMKLMKALNTCRSITPAEREVSNYEIIVSCIFKVLSFK